MFNQTRFSPLPGNFNPNIRNIGKKSFNWGNLLNNTQKTLGIINQSIPVFYQIKPIWNNAKTMFKVFGEFSKINNKSKTITNNNNTNTTQINQPSTNETNNPNFFI